MANQKAKLKQEASWKRKRWFNIMAPELFNNAVLGETLVAEAKETLGKTATVSLMVLTGDLKKQNVNVTFKVVSTHDNNAQTELVRYELAPTSIKRFVRRKRDRVDASFVCRTKDEKAVRVKPFIVTAYSSSRSITAQLQKRAVDFLVRDIIKKDYKQLVREVVEGRLQNHLWDALAKVYPLKLVSLRVLEIVDPKKVKVIEVIGGKQERLAQDEEVQEEVQADEIQGTPVEEVPAEETEEIGETSVEGSPEESNDKSK